jgi:hypothetical protein
MKHTKHRLGVLFAGCAAVFMSTPAHATTTFSIQPAGLISAPSGTGAFDVVLTNNGPSSISVAAFSFEITAGAGVTLTSADFATGVNSYIFAGDSFDIDNSATLYTNLLPAQNVVADDHTEDGAGITLASGESLALGDVLFSVSPTTSAGPVSLSLLGRPEF